MGFLARHPFLSLALVLFVIALPALVLSRRASFVRIYVPAAVGLACGLALAHAAIYLVRLRPEVEGVDFYNYLCVARDMRTGATDLSEWRYVYFPGVYAFWRFALWIGGGSLGGVQWVYVMLLASNASLLAAIVWRTVRSWLAAAVCAVGYIALVARLEGAFGIAEPIATLPVLIAVAAWSGTPLRGRRGLALAAILGIGIGLGAWVKQQGALQAAGWLALPLADLGTAPERRHEWRAMALVPAAAAITFAIAILAEGHGLLPLRVGLKAIGAFEAQSRWWANLGEIEHTVRPLLYASLLALVLVVVALRRRAELRSQPWVSVAGFAFMVALAALYQFSKRSYFHYGLLSAPWLMLAIVIAAVVALRALVRQRSPAVAFVALLACALPFVHTDDPSSDNFFLWPPASVPTPELGHWRKQGPVADDLKDLGKFIHAGEDVLVLPPRHDDIFFLTGARSVSWPQGYGWGFERTPAASAFSSPTLKAVVVLNVRDPTDAWTWGWHYCQDALKALPKAGFRESATLMTMTVWRRP
jgi:hypothetical protein